jgi:hypothetical protein
MAHPLVERSQRHLARGGQTRAERVAEGVKAQHPHAGAAARLLEALAHLRAVQRLAAVWMGEAEVLDGLLIF